MSMLVVRRDERLRARIVSVTPLVDPRSGDKVGAASAALLYEGRLLCVEDDALSVVWVDPGTLRMERTALLGGGERLSKAEKADFEAAFVARDGSIYVMGSGGTARRRRVARLEPGSGRSTVIDAGALYDEIGARLPVPPNIEGAVLLGDVVRLFHRANGRSGGPGASFDVALASLERGAGPIVAEALYDLGGAAAEDDPARSVPLTFTDAARLGDGRVLYLAAAEDSDDAIADGPILGAAVGVLEEGGGRCALLTEADGSPSRRKVEGVALLPGDREALVVTDPDDVERCAELCEVALEGPW